MKWLQGTWAARFNRFRGETGRPFQGRYKALHVEPGHALAQVAHYIHLNPVRAKVVTAERMRDFRWSSLTRFAAKDRPAGLEAETVLRESGGLADSVAGWRAYVNYLGALAEEEAERRDKKFGRLSRGWMVGSSAFKAELRQALVEAGSGRGRFELLGADRAAQLGGAGGVVGGEVAGCGQGDGRGPDAVAAATIGGRQGEAGGGDEGDDIGVEPVVKRAAENGRAHQRQPICAALPAAR